MAQVGRWWAGGPEISCAIETNETVANIKYVAPSAVLQYYVDVMIKARLWSCQLLGMALAVGLRPA